LHFWLAGYLRGREESVSLPADVKTTFVDVFSRGRILFYVGLCYSNQKPKQNVSLCSVKLSNVHFFKSCGSASLSQRNIMQFASYFVQKSGLLDNYVFNWFKMRLLDF